MSGTDGDHERPVPARLELAQARAEEGEVDQGDAPREGRVAVPVPAHEDGGDQDPGQGHGPGDGQPVGRGEVARLAEEEHHEEDGREEGPVDDIDVDLAPEIRRGVVDLHRRQQVRRDPLVDDREDPADHRLRRDHGRGDREEDEGDVEEGREGEDHLEEDARGAGVRQGERALAEVVDHEGDEDPAPGPPDRLAAEVAHVGVERLAAGRAEDHRGEDQERREAVREEKGEPEERVEREQHRRAPARSGPGPRSLSAANQTTMTGPKAKATRSVPRRWK